MSANEKKAEGIGLGLRVDMAARFLDEAPESVRWVEVHPENYIGRGGLYRSYLDRARERWPVLTHGLSTCLGDTEALDSEYMGQLRGFLGEVGTRWHSEHLCFGGRPRESVLRTTSIDAQHNHTQRWPAVSRQLARAHDRAVVFILGNSPADRVRIAVPTVRHDEVPRLAVRPDRCALPIAPHPEAADTTLKTV